MEDMKAIEEVDLISRTVKVREVSRFTEFRQQQKTGQSMFRPREPDFSQ